MKPTRGARSRAGAAALGLLLALAAGPGCQATWTPATAAPASALQWPYAPAAARVTYVHALSGLSRNRSVGTVVHAVVFGAAEDSDSFIQPVAVAVTGDGHIAVADPGRRCVHFYVPSTGLYQCLSGPEDRKMVSPVGVAFDEAGRLYVSDSVGRVFAFDAAGRFRFALEKAGDQPLQRPTGLAYSPTRKALYVVDTLAHSVRALSGDGALLFSFGGRGSDAGTFNFPTHITRSPAGELYVTDALNFRISIFDEDGRALASFGHHGDGSGDLAMPKGVAVDRDGILYVVDALFDNVQMFNRRGEFLLTVGARGTGFGEFWLPSGAFLTDRGELYVCDTYNRRIQVFRIGSGYANATS